jgi:hypothetical protein
MNLLTTCLIIFAFSLGVTLGEDSSRPFSATVNELWLRGQKASVLATAQKRLHKDHRDIYGLLLKYEYEISVLDLDALPTTMERLLDAARNVKTKQFVSVFPTLEESVRRTKAILPLYTRELLNEDRKKSGMSGKPMSVMIFIRALEVDGIKIE